MYTGEGLLNAFEVSLGSSLALFCCIKTIACVSGHLITKYMDKNRMQSKSGKPNTQNYALDSGNDLSPDVFLASKSKMMYRLLQRHVYLSGEESQELDIGIRETNWEKNIQDGSIPDSNLFGTLYEHEKDGVEINKEDGYFYLL